MLTRTSTTQLNSLTNWIQQLAQLNSSQLTQLNSVTHASKSYSTPPGNKKLTLSPFCYHCHYKNTQSVNHSLNQSISQSISHSISPSNPYLSLYIYPSIHLPIYLSLYLPHPPILPSSHPPHPILTYHTKP